LHKALSRTLLARSVGLGRDEQMYTDRLVDAIATHTSRVLRQS
jgi:hypothetical protein